MEESRKLVAAFVKFLESELQSNKHTSDAAESIEVALQCLQQAYNLEESPVPLGSKSLLEIFSSGSQSTAQTTQPSESQKSSAEHFREQGNSFMKTEEYDKAIECYSKAIDLDKGNAVFYCNRAAANTKRGNHTEAIADCEEAVKINPLYSKAYGRLGFVYLSIGNYAQAVRNYEKALQLEPENANYRNNLSIAKEKGNAGAEGAAEKPQSQSQPAGGMPNLGGLDFGALLSNPAVMNMAQNFMTNPQMQSMFQNLMGNMMGQGGADTDTTPTGGSNIPPPGTQQAPGSTPQAPGGQSGAPPNFNLADVFGATQQFAEQMQRTNPDLVNQLKTQFQQGQPRGPDQNPPGNC